MTRRLLLLVGIVPVSMLRRYWWVIPVVLVARELLGLVLFGTVVPWLYALADSLAASRGITLPW